MSFHHHQSHASAGLSKPEALAVFGAAVGLIMLSHTTLHAQGIPATITVNPKLSTTAVKTDADDPAIWIHPTDPTQSVIIGTDKGDNGGLYVWNMDGKQIQYVPLGRPNNVDVRYGMLVGGQRIDIAVTNLRTAPKQIKVFKINPSDGTLTDITASGGMMTPELADPYGICLYKRPSDGTMFVIESTQSGATQNLHQYRLEDDGAGKVKGTYVRAIGNGVIKTYVEGVVADDELGYVYASDEPSAIRKFYADPDRGDNSQIVAFATGDGINGDREGLGIYKCAGGTGYLVLSSQGNSTVKIYRREGEAGDPHKHTLITTIQTNGATQTDGLDITNLPTSANFPKGFLVKHNSPGKQFVLYAWEDIAQTYLSICPDSKPSTVGDDNTSALPAKFDLHQNYPNPLNPSTTIPFHLDKAASIKLTMIDLMGKTVRTLVAGQMAAGDHAIQWDGRNDAGEIVPSGTYLFRLDNGNQAQIKKLMLVK